MKSLLEEAKAVKTKRQPRLQVDKGDVLDLAIAYANREVEFGQVATAFEKKYGINRSGVFTRLSGALMTAIRCGKVTIERKKK